MKGETLNSIVFFSLCQIGVLLYLAINSPSIFDNLLDCKHLRILLLLLLVLFYWNHWARDVLVRVKAPVR